MAGEPPRLEPPAGHPASPLSLTGLRQLAELVRRLREPEALPESEGEDGGAGKQSGAASDEPSGAPLTAARQRRHPTPWLGQLPAVDAAAGGRVDRADGVSAGAGAAGWALGWDTGVTPP
jgi:hypothetical protein